MVLVIKIGGTIGVPLASLVDDICQLFAEGEPLVVVHGGSAEANRLSERLSLPPKTLRSPEGLESRYTDPETLEVITMAFTGLVNPKLVSQFVRRGIPAIGLSGVDGALIRAKLKPAVKHVENGRTTIVRNNKTGRITSVDKNLVRSILQLGLMPVISPPAIDLESGPVNVDADRMASAIAMAIGAKRLIFVSNTNGILQDLADPDSTIKTVTLDTIESVFNQVSGRMKAKVMAAEAALRGGVGAVHIANAGAKNPILEAMKGSGTRFETSHQNQWEEVMR